MRRYSLAERVDACIARLRRVQKARISGTVTNLLGLVAEVEGLTGLAAIGDRLALVTRDQRLIPAEVIGFRDAALQAMAFGPLDNLAHGARAVLLGPSHAMLDVAASWLGRVIDPLGEPLDQLGLLFGGPTPRPTRGSPPEATTRARLGPRIDLGVRALDCFATCRQGQRLGLFAGSGVGKSTLLSMLARDTVCDVVVLALVGERGREVREFIESDLGPDGMARSVVVVATSDSPPLMRRQCAYTAMTVAEYLRDQGKSVLLLMDSVTRFCLALREIGLSMGEPPATRGYPPGVFAELPRLLERAGPGPADPDGGAGFITGLFTVLVEGDDHNEPVADAVRGILDGHIVMDRKIAEAGRYPAIDVLRSLSRAAASCLDDAQTATVRRARAILSLQGEMSDMVRLGAYRSGTNAAVDEALRLAPAIDSMLRQSPGDNSSFQVSIARLNNALGSEFRMAGDPLQTLQSIRRRALEQSREALGTCLKAEADAEDLIRTLDDFLRRDGDTEMEERHLFLDMFAARMATVRADRQAATTTLANSQTRVAEARIAVAAARGAAEAVEQLIEERSDAIRAEAAKREQHSLDDIARIRLCARPHATTS